MLIRFVPAALASLVLALLSAAPAFAQDATAPPGDRAASPTMISNYLCDAGKTRIMQESFIGKAGSLNTIVAITTEAGNLYTVGVIGERAVIHTLKPAGEEKAIEMDGPMWLKHAGQESANYVLHTQGKPNDCRKVK